MTREEQIQEKAKELGQKYFPNEYNIWARENLEAKYVELACIEAVKWADENPKRYSQEELCDIQLEMMKQRDKRLLDKTCEWLKNTIDDDVLVKCGSVIKCMDVDDFVLYFRKAMDK